MSRVRISAITAATAVIASSSALLPNDIHSFESLLVDTLNDGQDKWLVLGAVVPARTQD